MRLAPRASYDEYEDYGPQGAGGPAGILGTISVVASVIGLIGQGCCCVPIISYLAMMVVPMAILVGIGTGIAGLVVSEPYEQGRTTSKFGLALGIFDVVFLFVWYSLMIFGVVGIMVLSEM